MKPGTEWRSDMKAAQTVYFTKYALTDGISERILADEFDKYEGSIMLVNTTRRGSSSDLVSKKFVHETKESAVDHAEELKSKKIASLERQIKKLKAKSF